MCSPPRQDRIKGAADSGALPQAGWKEGYGIQGKPAEAEAGVTLHQPDVHRVFSGEVVPGSLDPGSGGLHPLLGGEVMRVTCACTQASWWLQQLT